MLGLHRQSLMLEESSVEWPIAFRTEKARIEHAAREIDLTVEHIGSTAVPGLPAKPIIDIGLLLARMTNLDRLRNALVSVGYVDRGDKQSKGGHLFVRECEPDVRTHHVHVIFEGDLAWARYLQFRDALRTDRGLRQRYAALKQRLVRDLGNDRAAYMRAKTAFIDDVLTGV